MNWNYAYYLLMASNALPWTLIWFGYLEGAVFYYSASILLVCSLLRYARRKAEIRNLFVLIMFTIMMIILGFATIYSRTGIMYQGQEISYTACRNLYLDPWTRHSDSDLMKQCGNGNTEVFNRFLYFSVVTFTTLGYGDFSPTDKGRFVAATEALIGMVSMGLLIAIFIKIWEPLEKSEIVKNQRYFRVPYRRKKTRQGRK